MLGELTFSRHRLIKTEPFLLDGSPSSLCAHATLTHLILSHFTFTHFTLFKSWGYAWPMSVAVRALTALQISEDDSDDEILACLSLLSASSAGTGFLHESFNVNDVDDFTRSWLVIDIVCFGGACFKEKYSIQGCLLVISKCRSRFFFRPVCCCGFFLMLT
jgi:hypothetical protein